MDGKSISVERSSRGTSLNTPVPIECNSNLRQQNIFYIYTSLKNRTHTHTNISIFIHNRKKLTRNCCLFRQNNTDNWLLVTCGQASFMGGAALASFQGFWVTLFYMEKINTIKPANSAQINQEPRTQTTHIPFLLMKPRLADLCSVWFGSAPTGPKFPWPFTPASSEFFSANENVV